MSGGQHEYTPNKNPLRAMIHEPRWYESLDPGIRYAVRVLHAHGIETCQSCEGGGEHAYEKPTVDLLAGPQDAAGFQAVAILHSHGLPVDGVSLVWLVTDGKPYEPIWRVTFREKLDGWMHTTPMFTWCYQATVEDEPF